jgi:hypothetical protein
MHPIPVIVNRNLPGVGTPVPIVDVWVRFHLLSSVVPGQPVPVSWEILVGQASSLDVGAEVTASISLEGNEIWRRENVAQMMETLESRTT